MDDGHDPRFTTPEALGALVRAIVDGHHARGRGIHGVAHWGRVLENGLRLADATGANRTVVTLFAAFHDARRVNDHLDPGHGLRGARLARELRERWLDLSDLEMDLLAYACAHHTDGLTEADATVQACWDADRLDLPRVGIAVRRDRLCTGAARDAGMIAWAERRATGRYTPAFVRAWLPDALD
jgi:uncharacterized protein